MRPVEDGRRPSHAPGVGASVILGYAAYILAYASTAGRTPYGVAFLMGAVVLLTGLIVLIFALQAQLPRWRRGHRGGVCVTLAVVLTVDFGASVLGMLQAVDDNGPPDSYCTTPRGQRGRLRQPKIDEDAERATETNAPPPESHLPPAK